MTGRNSMRTAAAIVALVATIGLVGCSSSDDDRAGAPTTTSTASGSATEPPSSAAAPSTTPADVPSAMQARLAQELGAEVATQVLAAVDPTTLSTFESSTTVEEVATTPVLSYLPPRVADEAVDSLVIFAFGYRTAPDGSQLPGPVNEAMAAAAQTFVVDHPFRSSPSERSRRCCRRTVCRT